MAGRVAKLTVILGANQTGKTSLIEKILNSRPKDERQLILTPDPIEWQQVPEISEDHREIYNFTGRRRLIYDSKKTLEAAAKFDNGLIIYDDCRVYLMSHTDEEIARLFIRRAQKMADIFAVGHGFSEIPPRFFTFASEFILFRTSDNPKRRKEYFSSDEIYEKIKETSERINLQAVKNPHIFTIIKNRA